jgi:hypothetical protein
MFLNKPINRAKADVSFPIDFDNSPGGEMMAV